MPVWTSHNLLHKVVIFLCKHGCLFHLGQWESRQDTRSCTLFGQTIINAWGVSICLNQCIFSYWQKWASNFDVYSSHNLLTCFILINNGLLKSHWSRYGKIHSRKFLLEQHDGSLTTQRVLMKLAGVTGNSRKKVKWQRSLFQISCWFETSLYIVMCRFGQVIIFCLK